MQAKKRYSIAAVCGILLLLCAYCYVGWYKGVSEQTHNVDKQRSFLDSHDIHGDQDVISARQRRDIRTSSYRSRKCRMETCFDFEKCRNGFTVYVYPSIETTSQSQTYSEFLSVLRESKYYTTDPHKACIYVLSIDTLDRDEISQSYVKNVQSYLDNSEHWNGGLNHVIFNSYTGTWLSYLEDEFGFDVGQAILAKASISDGFYRPGFDISLPLFYKDLATKGGEPGSLTSVNIPPPHEYILVFKGKRYLTGIGSETRNSLYHIHNDKDIILVTTCKHGKGWEKMKDKRCEQDEVEYEKYDYKLLLNNSTFCLVPRGRRLGSYRFLEALQAGCIPVLLSNGWVLPFAEVIDWNKAVIWGDERLLLQIPSIVRSFSQADIMLLRQQTQFLWDTYFSSIEKIISTTLEILKDRVYRHYARSTFVWNQHPGALITLPEYSDNTADYPFYWNQLGLEPVNRFTAVIYATSDSVMPSSPIYKLVKYLGRSKYLHQILILCHCDNPPPLTYRWPVPAHVPINVKVVKSLSSRFFPYNQIVTDAVLSLDEDALLTTDEVDFAFSTWKNFPERIVGYPSRNHYWDDTKSQWGYTSKWTNAYSIVLTGAAFLHRYYYFLYSNFLSQELHKTVDQFQNCEDLLMNFLVSHATKQPPIKLTRKKTYKDSMLPGTEYKSKWLESSHFKQRQQCLNSFVDKFGYMPLKRTNMRLDPVLYKDQVSIFRKKYRQIEAV